MAKPKRKAAKNKPVTQHQLFPAVVALWFGALFGLGSLAVRPSLLEGLVIKSRIDLLIPAAAPPLGMTARMLVALVLAALGASLGVAIARRLARPRQEVRERKRTSLSTRDEGAGARHGQTNAAASTRYPGTEQGSPGLIAGRRRSLAIEHEEDDFVPHDMAPLPGGAPQIFDIAAAGLGDAAPELGAFAEPASPPIPAFEPPPAAAPMALDWANAAPVLPPSASPAPVPAGIEAQRQMFQAAEAPVEPAPAMAVEPEVPAAQQAHEAGRQVFGMAPPASAPAELPRQIFGAPVTDDHVPREFVESQGFRTSVFEVPEPNPLFAAREETVPAAPLSAPAAVPEAYEPPPEAAAPAAAAERIVTEPAPEPALPSPASLGIEDLSARLAESMRRRRAARAGAPEEAVAAPAPSVPDAPALVPQAYVPEEPEPLSEPEPAAQGVADFTVPRFEVPPFTVPAAAPAEPAAPAPIPAALRPLDLTGFEEGDQAVPDSLLPPRLVLPPVEAVQAAAPVAVEPEVAEEAEVAEESYASLLGVTPSPAGVRNPFVRVEEAEEAAETIEPVVIFPGQAVPVAEDPAPFRRFDSPASAGQGQPVAANEAASAVAPEEAERALRSALANLQRMSGAA